MLALGQSKVKLDIELALNRDLLDREKPARKHVSVNTEQWLSACTLDSLFRRRLSNYEPPLTLFGYGEEWCRYVVVHFILLINLAVQSDVESDR